MKKGIKHIFLVKVGNPVLLSKLFRLLSYSMRAQDDFLFAKHSFFSDFDGEKEKKVDCSKKRENSATFAASFLPGN